MLEEEDKFPVLFAERVYAVITLSASFEGVCCIKDVGVLKDLGVN